MLVLSRKVNERLILGKIVDGKLVQHATIVVVEIRGDKSRLGIDAEGYQIHRQEVWDAIKRGEKEQFNGE